MCGCVGWCLVVTRWLVNLGSIVDVGWTDGRTEHDCCYEIDGEREREIDEDGLWSPPMISSHANDMGNQSGSYTGRMNH